MRLVKDGANTPRSSKHELRVQALASRKAVNELLRVPWPRFRRAYEEYPRWQALALWGEAITGRNSHPPSLLVTTLKQNCPGFVQAHAQWRQSWALHLLDWVHTNRFGKAKRERWLSALIFYGARHPAARAAWAHWENCEREWGCKRPASFPSFERWWRSAQQQPICAAPSGSVIAVTAESLIEWEAFTLWLRPLFFGSIGLPPQVLSELKRCCPGIVNIDDQGRSRGGSRSSMWRRILAAGNDRLLSQARREGWLAVLLEQVRSHPWHVRTHAYAARWRKEWRQRPKPSYPSLREWKQVAAEYVTIGPASRSPGQRSPRASLHTS